MQVLVYPRKCDKCHKNIISVYAPETPFPIYCNKCWWADDWDASQYGKDFDFSKTFFEQFLELMNKVPQLAIQNDDGIGSVNCEYCQDFAFGKNCYFVIGSWYSEDSFYSSMNASHNRNICDCIDVSRSELVYESLDSQGLYQCGFMQNSENCSDCWFGFDLKGCKNCFGCVNLRQKQFHIFNQPYSEEEYKKKIASYLSGSFEALEKIKQEYQEWVLKFPRKNMNMQNCENSEGDHLLNCRNSSGFSLLKADSVKFFHQGDNPSFSYDIFNSGRPQWCYEGLTPDDSYLTHFSWFSWKNKFVLYGFNCHSSEQLFGCVSLHRAKYSILNKKYSKEEYEALVPRIIEHMGGVGIDVSSNSAATASARHERGGSGSLGLVGPKLTEPELYKKEWGEFLAIKYSPFAYNETVAQEYFPLSKEAAIAQGWKWRAPDPKQFRPQAYKIPDNIKEVPDTVVQEILACTHCTKNYKVIPQELKLYKKMMIPLPRKCPDCRHRQRLSMRTPYKLWQRTCAKCAKSIKTAYAPERPGIVYCEECYLKEVY